MIIRPERLGLEMPGAGDTGSSADDTGSSAVHTGSSALDTARSAAVTNAGSRSALARVPGRISQGTFLGDQTEYRVQAEGMGELVIRRQNEAARAGSRAFGPGEAVVVTWREESSLVVTE